MLQSREIPLISSGNCAVFASMAKDFGEAALPSPEETGKLYYNATGSALYQVATWDIVAKVLEEVFYACVAKEGKPGWSVRAGDIVVAIVPSNSGFRSEWWSSDGTFESTEYPGLLASSS